MKGIRARLLVLWVVTSVGPSAHGATLRVPEDFSTIAAACRAADAGDEVIVSPGVHGPAATQEAWPILVTQELTIRGAGADRTVLDGAGLGALLVIDTDESVRVADLSLERGAGDGGGSVRLRRGRTHFVRVRFSANGGAPGALVISGGKTELSDCLFDDNNAPSATVAVSAAELLAERCTFAGNAGPALDAHDGAAITLRRSVVVEPGKGGGPGQAVALRMDPDTRLILEDNLFDGCVDGILTTSRGAVPSSWLREARERGGLRTATIRFVDAFGGDYRLAKPEGAVGEVGADGLAPGTHDPERGSAASPEEGGVLGPNFPNPGNPGTTIHYSVPVPTIVDLGVYNVLGQRIRSLVSGYVTAGEHQETWDGRDDLGEELPTGIYFIRVTRDGVTESRRLVLVR